MPDKQLARIRERGGRFWACVLLVLAICRPAAAQTPVVTNGTDFGHSIALKGSWVAAAGNDPRWAEPGCDDSGWVTLEPGKPLSRQGFAGARSMWYRTQVRVRPDGPPLAIYIEGMEYNFALYANGRLIGQRGELGERAVTLEPRNEGYAIPPGVVPGDGLIVLAFHVTGGPIGFLDMPPFHRSTKVDLVGPENLSLRESFRLAHDWIEPFALMGLNLLVGLCGLVIWWSLRDQREYLAMAIWLFCNVVTVILNFSAHLQAASPTSWFMLLLVLVEAVSSVAELEFMRLLLQRPRNRLWITLETVAFLINFLDPLVSTGRLPISFGVGDVIVRPLVTEVFVALVLLRATLRGNRDAPVLLFPVLVWSVADVYTFVRLILWFSVKILIPELPSMHVFSYTITASGIADTFGLLSLMLIIILRSVRLSHEKADLAAEVAAAEELQVLLLARSSRPTPGFQVETVYRPMEQVGGDFFLVQPCEEEGSVVAIVGDVSGKGLQAAMRVSMILGVLQRKEMGQPDHVLSILNTALLVQNEFGFTTACCVRLETDGSFCYANAGHLNPYIDGEELDSDGALPLGMSPDAVYEVRKGRLQPGQRIVLLSDGVAEARSKEGELFGFERVQLWAGRKAADILEEVQRFGQEDDVTVLSLTLA